MWIFTILVVPVLLVQASVLPEMGDISPILGESPAREQERDPCPSFMLFDRTRNECVCVGHSVYYPPKHRCFLPFEQGPCEPGHYLAIPKDPNVAECVVNTCGNNGTLPYKNSCYTLYTTGPCKSPDVLLISENMMELECGELPGPVIEPPEWFQGPQESRRNATLRQLFEMWN